MEIMEISTTLTVNVKKVERIKQIREELLLTLRDLREKVQALENERSQLLEEIEELRKAARSRITDLEGEISQMRDEAKSLREVLGNKSKQDVSSLNVSEKSDSS